MEWALETCSLTRRFGDTLAVDGVSLQVPPGCICGFLGPNGAGKTTTLRLILGLLRADCGTIALRGEVVHHARTQSRRTIDWRGTPLGCAERPAYARSACSL